MRRTGRVQLNPLGSNGLVRYDPFVRFFTADPAAAVAVGAPPAGQGDPAPSGDGGGLGGPDGDEPLGESGLKALQAEREARKQYEKDLADTKARLKEFEDAQKSEEEKRNERLASAEKTAAENSLKALRYEVAAEKGIDLKLAGRLTGTTKKELEADADELLTLLGEQKNSTPRPDPSQGSRGPHMPEVQPGVPRLAQAFETHLNRK